MRNRLCKGLLLIALLVVTLNIAAQGLPPLTHGLTKLESPYEAPQLKFRDLDDELIDIRQMHGEVAIVNFWATWCPPCRREKGSLERL